MEFKERVGIHRSTLEQVIDTEKLYPLLQQYKAISAEEISKIEFLPSKTARAAKLLDLFLSKDNATLQSFKIALQKTYQHILPEMFKEPQFSASSRTPDSEDERLRPSVLVQTDPRAMDFVSHPKVTTSVPTHQCGSSIHTFNEHPLSDESHSPCPPIDVSDLNKHGFPDKGYEWFFKQFESAFHELKVLKQQNAEMIAMKEQVSKEAGNLRKMYKTNTQCLQQATAEVHSLKGQQVELMEEKKQLLDEIANLQKLRAEDKQELADLRHQQRKVVSEQGAIDGVADVYTSILDKYENMHQEFDILREKYQELALSRNSALSSLDTLSEENKNLRSQLEEMRSKNDALSSERNGLKQHSTNCIREWNQILSKSNKLQEELNDAREKLTVAMKQRDSYGLDMKQTFYKHADLKKKYEALQAEKDAAVKEYALVMSERDTVHKEIEQLQDKLSSTSKNSEVLGNEKKAMEVELETLRQEFSAVLTERDKYRRERNDISGINKGLKHENMEYQMRMAQERDIARKERNDAYEHMEQIIKETQIEKAEEIDHVTKETETLKKESEKLKVDLENAEKEAEDAKKNRDKAFSERDKIVQERESIRTLCDNLRRDRDRAVSDLAQALRDSDDFKRQKNEALKELKEIKSRYEAMVEKDTRRQQLHYIGHNHSHDSAIDADLQDLGAETVEIPVDLDGVDGSEMGFDVVGGKDDPQFPNDPSLIVSHVGKGGVAEGKLRVNDTILRINSLDTVNIEKKSALQALWNSKGAINMMVRRRKSTGARILQPVQIVLSCQKDPGIQIDQGLFITRIYPGGVVAKYGMLPYVGDRIISINNTPADSITASDAMRILQTSADSLVLDVWRQASPFSSAGSSPTPTSTGINSPLPEGIAVSSNMSKSDTLAVRSSSWESPSDTSRSAGSSRNLRSSGSQTDSLDSPGPSPRKALRTPDHDKVRHSLPMLDKAKEKVEKMFKSRHKHQERDKEAEEKKKEEEERSCPSQDAEKCPPCKLVEDCGTQVNLLYSDNNVNDFSNNVMNSPVFSKKTGPNDATQDVRPPKYSRKRELELDNNNGTWPKTRGPQSTAISGAPAVIFSPGGKQFKERPRIKDMFNASFEKTHSGSSYERPVTSSSAVLLNSQNPESTTTITTNIPFPSSSQPSSSYSTPSSQQPPSSVVHSVNTPIMPTPTPSSPPAAIPASSKSQSHFSVGIMYGPGTTNPPSQSFMPSRGPAAYNKPTAAQIYGTIPSNRHNQKLHSSSTQQSHIPHMDFSNNATPAIPSEFRFESATLQPTRANPKVQQMKSRRPNSATHSQDRPWHGPPAPLNWLPSRITSESPLSHLAAQQGMHGTRLNNSASPLTVNSHTGALGTGSSPYYMNGTAHQMVSHSPSARGLRPNSLEVPPSIKVKSELSFDLPERPHMSSPIAMSLNSGLAGRPRQFYQGNESSVTSPSPSQQPPLPPPYGTFPVINPADTDPERPLSFCGASSERYSSPSPSQKSYSTLDTQSEDFSPVRYQWTHQNRSFLDDEARQAFTKRDKALERIRIPSCTSVNTKSGSVEIVSDRSSPGSPKFLIKNRGSIECNSILNSDECIYTRKRPIHHETRDIDFLKSSKPIGFKIQYGPSGGIFVSSVNENSLAAQAGLVIGDQLLEVCGINMRNAKYDHAVKVLRHCGNNLTIKVQYNPEKYTDMQDASSSNSFNSSMATSPSHSSQAPSEKGLPKHQLNPTRQTPSSDLNQMGPRMIRLKKSNPNMLGPGFSFVGGNAVGIFINEVFHDCFVEGAHRLLRGDHILEFNSVDFRTLTAEKAMMELNRPCANIDVCVVYNFLKFNKIQSLPCDSFYIKANFDRLSEGDGELSFHKDDTLFVDNSLYKSQLGMWFAWLVNEQGIKLKGGIIPSRIRLEDEIVLRRSHSESWSLHESEDLKGSRRGSASARRSFFRRKRHLRNNSKDSHEFGSFSDASLNSDSVPILDDSVLGYTQVEKIEMKSLRPVLLLAPLAESLINKLVSESPDKYAFCEPATMRASDATMEQSLNEGVVFDYWQEDDVYLCVRASAVKEICDRNVHSLLNVNPSAIERMHKAKVYPVVIFVRHKNAKQIRDVRDPQFIKDKATTKLAKEQFEHFQKIDQEHHHLFSAIVQGGNLAEMCMQIKTVIASEQGKAVWAPMNSF